jgi:hypothetical protein
MSRHSLAARHAPKNRRHGRQRGCAPTARAAQRCRRKRRAPSRRHQVDAFSRAANEHDLGRIVGVDETGDLLARSRQVIGSATGECVHPRRIGIVQRVVLHERVDDRLRSERPVVAAPSRYVSARSWTDCRSAGNTEGHVVHVSLGCAPLRADRSREPARRSIGQ